MSVDRRALADRAGRRRAALVLGDHGDAGARERLAEGRPSGRVVERGLQLRRAARPGAAGRRSSPCRRRRSARARSQTGPALASARRSVSSASRGGARVERLLGRAHARLERVGAARDVDRGARVERGDVARAARPRRRRSAASPRRCPAACRRRRRRRDFGAGRRPPERARRSGSRCRRPRRPWWCPPCSSHPVRPALDTTNACRRPAGPARPRSSRGTPGRRPR